MIYNGYMRRGGCTTCGVSNNTNYRSTYSPNFYNNGSSSSFTNDSSDDLPQNSLPQYNARLHQRIMTPPRNFSNYRYNINNDYPNSNPNNYRNYYSPSRYTGCRNCAVSSPKIFTDNNYIRPSTANYLKRNNLYNYNNNLNNRNDNDNEDNEYQFRKNYDNNNRYQNDEEYNFSKRYYNNNRNNDLFENTYNYRGDNYRYLSPQRNIVNSISSSNINRNSNTNIYRNNNYNDNVNYDVNKDKTNINVQRMLNNKYRNFLNDNINKYSYNNNNDTNYNKPQKRNYYSPSIKPRYIYNSNNIENNYNNDNINNRNNNTYLNPRYKYLLPKDQNNINNTNGRFIMLNIYNYQRELKEIIQDRKSFFLFIYGTHDFTGKSWCSDCNIAMPIVEEAKNVIKSKKYEKEIYFLSLPIDKINMDYLRDDPIVQLERVPTLIYFGNGVEKNRLIENDLFSYQVVNNFINQAYEQYNYDPIRRQYLYQPRKYY